MTAAVWLGLILAATLAPASALAAFPGENGRIAYQGTHVGEGAGIFTILPDGSGRERIDGLGSDPSWSADGRRLVIVRFQNHRNAVVTIGANGGTPAPVVDVGSFRQPRPSFSPDGSRILYIDRTEIRTIRVDGTDPRLLLRARDPVQWARYSPNGRRIVFVGDPRRGVPEGIWTMRSNGSRLRNLTSSTRHYFPDYSPDGRRIAFVRIRHGRELIVMRSDGTRKRTLIDDEGILPPPAFAPAGDRIAFAWTPTSVLPACTEIHTVSTRGTDRRSITHHCDNLGGGSGAAITPSWQPLPPAP